MPASPSTKQGFARPADADFINSWPATARSFIDALDQIVATFITTTPRPAAGVSGRFHRAADGTISFDTGSAWEEIGRAAVLATQLQALPPIGAVIAYAGGALPAGGTWDWADGGLIDKTTYAAFFTGVGHAYNGGVDPGSNKVRKPDKRGRVMVGADDMGTGAANRLPNTARARGQNHGEERHTQLLTELAAHLHSASESAHSHSGTAISSGSTLDHSHNIVENLITVSGIGGGAPVHAVDNWTGQTNHGTQGASVNLDHTHPLSIGATAAGVTVASQGSSLPMNNMQPGEVDNMIVRIA